MTPRAWLSHILGDKSLGFKKPPFRDLRSAQFQCKLTLSNHLCTLINAYFPPPQPFVLFALNPVPCSKTRLSQFFQIPPEISIFPLAPFLVSATRRHCSLLYEGTWTLAKGNTAHNSSSGVIPYLMAVSKGERQRGG